MGGCGAYILKKCTGAVSCQQAGESKQQAAEF
jgi:hypothetical protein